MKKIRYWLLGWPISYLGWQIFKLGVAVGQGRAGLAAVDCWVAELKKRAESGGVQ